MPALRNDLVLHYETACLWEATARKVGNVHPGAAFADVEFVHFPLSAAASGRVIGHAPEQSAGKTILHAVQATASAVRSNTNLGIILLIAPLAATDSASHWRDRLQSDLAQLTREDARFTYEAIRLAHAGGMGEVPEQDVREEPNVTLLEAMQLAADRDMIARQYANGFADVFDFGVPAFQTAFAQHASIEAAVIESQLRWLAEYPDSLIARKKGLAAAGDVQQRATQVLKLGGISTADGRRAGTELDRYLRSDGNALNPGTTADLVTACLFVALRENNVSPSFPFRWHAPDWLTS